MFSSNDVNKRKVFSITMVINEEDLIESFVRYHASILDGMVIWDIGSADNTPSILNELEKEGLPIYIFRPSTEKIINDGRISMLLQYTLQQFSPDFIFPLDSDEFLFSSKGNHARNVIDSLELNKVYYIKSITYVPQSTDEDTELFIPRRIQHACPEETQKYYKVGLSKDIFLKHNIRFTAGKHDIIATKKSAGAVLKEKTSDLKIAHFPIRSSEQIMSKVTIGWMNTLSRPNHKPGEAFHWETFYNKIKKDRYLFKKDFQEIVQEYLFNGKKNIKLILRPLDLSFCKDISCKFTNPEGIDPIKNLLQNCECMAKQYAKLKNTL